MCATAIITLAIDIAGVGEALLEIFKQVTLYSLGHAHSLIDHISSCDR